MNNLTQNYEIQTSRLKQLLSSSRVAILSSTILAGILAYMQLTVITTSIVIAWLSLVVLIAISRAALVFNYQNSPLVDDFTTHTRLKRFRFGVLIAGVIWGSSGFLMFPANDPQHQMFLIFMLAGLSAGGVISLSADFKSAIIYSVSVITPLIIRLFIAGDNLSLSMGMAGMLYLSFTIMSMRYINRNLSENIILRLEAVAHEETVMASEERYRLLLNHSPVGIFHYDKNLIITYCNNRLGDILHNSVDGIVGLDLWTINDQSILPSLSKALAGEIGYYEGHYSASFSDAKGWIALTCASSRDNKGEVVGGIGILQDITERKHAEDMLHSRTNELELHNHILSQINQRKALPEVLNELACQVEALHSGMICSILLLDIDGKTLHTAAAPSLPNFYNQAVDGLTIGEGVGSCGTAAFRGERVIVEDIQKHPFWGSFLDLAQQADVQSCWSQPFKNKDDKVLGTFAIYHKQPTHPTDSELIQIERYANLAQLAIEIHQAQNDLRISSIAFQSQEGMLVTDANRAILRVNRAFSNITGYTAEEVIGQTLYKLSSEQHNEAFYTEMWARVHYTGEWEGEVWNRRKSGEVYPEYLNITAVKDVNDIITNYVATLTDITERKQAADEIEHLAFYDSLTQLPNRRLLLDRLKRALAASARSGRDGGLLFLDLDHFKTLNDSLGHAIGDMLLQQVAERLTNCMRESDTVGRLARLGGDEFVVMLEDLSSLALEAAAQVKVVGEKIMTVLNQPYQLATHEYHSTVSIGVALFSDYEHSQEDLLKHADIAMYQAKKTGRNTMCFFDHHMQDAINTRADLERELRKAIEKQQFQLYYQIQVNHFGHALGAEALIRWLHPERGLVSPFHFIPLAEETGLILSIGQWVLETACAQLNIWGKNEFTRALTISINVSAKQFYQPDFVDQVRDAVQRQSINPMQLKLELTESILLENVEDTIATMSALKEIGIRFSLDDFGTGYSSLQYLKRLPLYQLKIDQSFVRDIVSDSSDKAIVRTIIAMAKSMELEVIAEGVETIEQQQLLLNKGCMHYQGYLFGRPLPIMQFEDALKHELHILSDNFRKQPRANTLR
jgi:diguanylate cyclase (GGDEF)-like protein/PAS domain S-box-containing protein